MLIRVACEVSSGHQMLTQFTNWANEPSLQLRVSPLVGLVMCYLQDWLHCATCSVPCVNHWGNRASPLDVWHTSLPCSPAQLQILESSDFSDFFFYIFVSFSSEFISTWFVHVIIEFYSIYMILGIFINYRQSYSSSKLAKSTFLLVFGGFSKLLLLVWFDFRFFHKKRAKILQNQHTKIREPNSIKNSWVSRKTWELKSKN